MPLHWGILTVGNIARSFAAGLKESKTGRLVAVGARELARAEAFAAEFGGKGYGSYDEVLDDPAVEAVYIATPHHLHAEWTIKAAHAGKAVLCEKPFTLNASEAEAAIAEVRRAGVFFMEAFMYRCSPQTRKLVELIDSGAIGRVRAMTSEFGFNSSPDWKNFRTDGAVGGGGLMDVGTYCVSLSRLIARSPSCYPGDGLFPSRHGFLSEPTRAEYMPDLTRGYDAYGVGCLEFDSGLLAKFGCGVHLQMRNDAVIYGDEGRITMDNPWLSPVEGKLTVARHGEEPVVHELGVSKFGLYAHEADAVAAFIDRRECPYMPVEDTLANMRCLDRLRQSCGYKFSNED